jgi:hypothetical protein
MPRLGAFKVRSRRLDSITYAYTCGKGWADKDAVEAWVTKVGTNRWTLEIQIYGIMVAVAGERIYPTKKDAVSIFEDYAVRNYGAEVEPVFEYEEPGPEPPQFALLTADELIMEIYLWIKRNEKDVSSLPSFGILRESVEKYVRTRSDG